MEQYSVGFYATFSIVKFVQPMDKNQWHYSVRSNGDMLIPGICEFNNSKLSTRDNGWIRQQKKYGETYGLVPRYILYTIR